MQAVMPRHISHRAKRITAKQHHVRTLQRLYLHDARLLSELEVLPGGCILCSTFFELRNVSVVTCSVPSV